MVRKKHAYVVELGARLIRDIRHGRASSRLELSQRLKLAPSTVGIHIDRLLASGHLREELDKESNLPGRRAQRLVLRGDVGCFVGVEFEARTLHAVSVDFAGSVLRTLRSEIPEGANADEVLEALSQAIASVRGSRREKLLGIGVGVPGLVEPASGLARHYRFIEGWRDIPVVEYLRARFPVPILLENNVRATTMGIMLFEKIRNLDNFVCVLIRSGVGAGIVRDGALYCGTTYTAGEVGRIPLLGNGTDAHTTLEDTTSLQAILSFAREHVSQHPDSLLSGKDISIADLIQAAKDGDELARKSLSRAISNMGWLSHLLALVENPSAIIFAGPLNDMGEWLRLEIQASLSAYSARSRTEKPRILLTTLGENVGALGAASLALEAWKPATSSET